MAGTGHWTTNLHIWSPMRHPLRLCAHTRCAGSTIYKQGSPVWQLIRVRNSKRIMFSASTHHMYKQSCQFQMASHEQASQLQSSTCKLTLDLEQITKRPSDFGRLWKSQSLQGRGVRLQLTPVVMKSSLWLPEVLRRGRCSMKLMIQDQRQLELMCSPQRRRNKVCVLWMKYIN